VIVKGDIHTVSIGQLHYVENCSTYVTGLCSAGGSKMKGKGIQVTNKAYRDGWDRTFKKDSEIPSLLDSAFEPDETIVEVFKFSEDTEMEGWPDQLVSSAGLHDDYIARCIFSTQDERK